MNDIAFDETKLDKTQLFYDALKAYVSANKLCNEWPALPTRAGSSISRKSVTLRSGSFIMARYNCTTKELFKSKNK